MQQIIYAAATSVGVAACFGAPIGGLMFSIEITSSNYPTRAYWYGSLSSFFAAFTFRILWNLYAGVPVCMLSLLSYRDPWPVRVQLTSIFPKTLSSRGTFSSSSLSPTRRGKTICSWSRR
jgi:H+/Cl- antiporter ClcA